MHGVWKSWSGGWHVRYHVERILRHCGETCDVTHDSADLIRHSDVRHGVQFCEIGIERGGDDSSPVYSWLEPLRVRIIVLLLRGGVVAPLHHILSLMDVTLG